MNFAPASPASPVIRDTVVAAALAAAERLPVPHTLRPAAPVVDRAGLRLPADAGGAVAARLVGDVDGEILVVVGRDVVDALAASPLGRLELVPAVQPALDAAAAVFGAVTAESARELPTDVALETLAGPGTVVAVPLVAEGREVALVGVRLAAPLPRQDAAGSRAHGGLDLLRDVEMEVTAELGRTRMTVRDLLSLTPGAVVELDRAAGSPADLLVNGTLIARGEVVVVDEDFGIRITEIINPTAESRG